MSLISQLESILFVASKPLTFKELSKALNITKEELLPEIENLKNRYNVPDSGIHILFSDDTLQMSTNPDNKEYVNKFIKEEISEELTKPQLETLTVIAYRGPITRPEMEQIRGVNCSVIVRNLMMRGLVVERDNEEKMMPEYLLAVEALRHLGISDVKELPDYEILHNHDNWQNV